MRVSDNIPCQLLALSINKSRLEATQIDINSELKLLIMHYTHQMIGDSVMHWM